MVDHVRADDQYDAFALFDIDALDLGLVGAADDRRMTCGPAGSQYLPRAPSSRLVGRPGLGLCGLAVVVAGVAAVSSESSGRRTRKRTTTAAIPAAAEQELPG